MKAATNNIRKIRQIRGLSGKDLSAKVSISQGYLSDIETGVKHPTSQTLAAIAAALGVGIDDLGMQSGDLPEVGIKDRITRAWTRPDVMPSVKIIAPAEPVVDIQGKDICLDNGSRTVLISNDGDVSVTVRFPGTSAVEIIVDIRE